METLRSILELLYFLSGPALAVFAFYGLGQLKIAKDNARMSSKREAYRLASDQISLYVRLVIPAQRALEQSIAENKLKLSNYASVRITGNTLSLEPHEKAQEAAKDLEPVSNQINDVLNGMEGFAVFFTSGVADERIAFTSIGRSFCERTKIYLPIIMLVQQNLDSSYPHLFELFILWHQRLESIKLLKDRQEIDNRLDAINHRAIKPIGTED